MPSDYENGAKKTIDISIKAEKMTADVLKSALREFMSGKAEKKGRMTYKQLQAKSPSKLDSIEVSDRNIGDFLKIARKYDVDFALKRDKSTTPPTYHVFFSAAKTEDFKKAFSEYVGKGQGKSQKRGEFTREQMQQQAQKLRSKPRKQKQRENKGEQTMIYGYFMPEPIPRVRGDDIFTAIFDADTSRKEKSANCRSTRENSKS